MEVNKMFGNEREYLKKQLLRAGLDEAEAEEVLSKIHLVCKGKRYGHVHIEDVSLIAYQALDMQNAKSITLKVSKEEHDEYDGHLDIQVMDVEE